MVFHGHYREHQGIIGIWWDLKTGWIVTRIVAGAPFTVNVILNVKETLSLPVMTTKLIVPVDMLVFHHETFMPRLVFGSLGDLVMGHDSYDMTQIMLQA